MTPRHSVRLVDVAKRAGVTVSPASRALARPEMVRPETRERVEWAAAELGYEPNRAARSLITESTGPPRPVARTKE
jgi:DNA-binding LacI/PurR family transcriptional regulator